MRPCTLCWRPVHAGRVACMYAEIYTAMVQNPDAKNCIAWRCEHSARLPGSNVLIGPHGAPAESIGCNRAGVSDFERRAVCGIDTGADSCAGYGSVRRNWGSSHCWRPGVLLLLLATTQFHTVWTCVMLSRLAADVWLGCIHIMDLQALYCRMPRLTSSPGEGFRLLSSHVPGFCPPACLIFRWGCLFVPAPACAQAAHTQQN